MLEKGINHPPKNKIIKKLAINNILLYSPKKKRAKVILEYSTLYPATNSASASGKSKGARFVSANIDIKKTILQGNKGIQNQIVAFCINTISKRLKDPVNKTTGNIVKPIETS